MERPQSTEFVVKDTPLLSLSAIGPPAAFSTAVKQPGSTTSRAVSNGDSPFTNLGALQQEPSPQQREVNGRLSLNSTLSDKGGVQSLNNTGTSLGILDLDAMQDSSMHRFLTSPFDSHDLHLHMSSTMSAPSTQASGAIPAVSDINGLSHPANGVTPHHGIITPTTEQSLGIPQELLMRQLGSEYSMSSEDTETPDLFASQASPTSPPTDGSEYSDDNDDDDDDDNQLAIAEAIKGALDELELMSSSIYTEEGQEYEDETSSPPPPPPPPHTNTTPTATPQQNGAIANTKSQFSASPVTKGSGLFHPRTLTTAGGTPLSSSPIVNGHRGTSLKLDLSLGAGGEREGESSLHPGGGGDETLIGDEVEPSVMREADEFSRFDPSHLSSLLAKESFSATSPKSLPPQNSSTIETKPTTTSLPVESEVDGKEVSPSKREDSMMEGKSEEGDVSSRTESALSYSASEGGSPTQTMEGLPSALLAPTSYAGDQSTVENSALLASLAPSPHEQPVDPLLPTAQPSSLTKSLDNTPFSAGGFDVPASAEADGGAKNLSGVYNPFDSDDNGSVESFGQLEFGDHSADSFMAQLAKDEEEIKATHLTPSSEQFQSFTSVLGSSHFSTSLGDNLSIDTYFQKKSGKMGQLSASKLPPSERPRFSDTAGHVIESPDINQSMSTTSNHMTSIAPSTTHPPLEPIPEGDALDSTLVSENADKNQSPPTLPSPAVPAIASSSSSQTSGTSDDLTPLITSHSPFPAKFDVPKLDFANAFAASRHSISPISSQPHSTGVSTLLTSSSPLLQKFSKSSPLPHTGETSSVGLPPELLKPAAVDDSTTSTLLLKEMSALTLSSPPSVLDPSLMSMPTPSIAKLPSFDITEMTNTQHFASFSSSRDVTSSNVGLDHSLLQSQLTSPDKSKVLSGHAKSTTSPAKLVAGVASSTTTMVSQGHSSPSKLIENPLSLQAGVASSTATMISKDFSSLSKLVENPLTTAKASPTKVIFSPKRPPPVTSRTSEHLQTSPERFQVTQVLSTETLTTWSSNSPLTSPPQGLKSPTPPPIARNLSAENAPTPNKKSGTALSSGAHSPKTEAARKKLASLQAQLDAARFNADEFLTSLNGSDGPPNTGKSTLTSKSSPTKTSGVPMSSTSPSPKSKVSPPSSHSGAKKSSAPISRPNKPFMSMPANSSAPKKRVAAAHETSTSPEKGKRESGQATKLKASTGLGESDQFSSKYSPSRKKARGTPTKREADQLHKASAKDGSTLSPSSEAKRLSPSKVVKSPRVQTEVGSAKKRHVHIQEPQSGLSLKSSSVKKSMVMSSGGENPHKLNIHTATSSTVDTLSSAKFTLSSLLTSHAHTSPPPLSTLTTSTSPSPSPQGHSPPRTSSSTASHPIISIPPDNSTQPSPPSTTSQSSQPALITQPLTKGPTPHTMKLAKATIDPSVLKVPDSLCFSQVCCVGVSVSDQLIIANFGERWLQLEFRLAHLYRDGTECSLSESVFSLPQRSFVGPEQQETIKVTFSPSSGGSYEAVVAVYAHLVVSSSTEINEPVANVIVKAVAEEPQIEIQTASSCGSDDGTHGRALSPPVLDYGVMVGGSTATLQLRLANRGHAPLPLCLSITAKSALSQLYFSFGEVPQSLVSVLHPSSLGSSHLLHPHHHTLILTLPPAPRPDKGHSDLEWYSIDVCFHAPRKFVDDSISDPGPPEEISAQLMFSINGWATTQEHGSIASIPMQVIVGLARLHVPRAMQSVSLSCAAGRATTKELPFRNAGNIPLRVRLKVSSNHPELFNISPDFLLIKPRQESQVNVYFSSSSPLVCEGALLIHIEPNGPNYELKLQGEATLSATPTITTATTTARPTAVEATPTEAAVVMNTATAAVREGSESTRPGEEGRENEGVLSCNKRVLYWGGVELSKSVYQEVILHNSHSVAIPLSISIRHPDSSFKLKSVGGDEEQTSERLRKVELFPGMQLPVGVVYTPTSATVSLSALDISDLFHSKKYRLRLCGYGGRGQVEVVSGRRVSGECWVDLGEITRGRRITTKISVYNSGLREAFVTASCYPDKESSCSLPVDHVNVTPSKLILPPQQIKDLLLVYHTNERDDSHCRSYPALLACIKLTTGDEILRQRLQKTVTWRFISSLASQHQEGEGERGRGTSSRLKNASNKVFLARFPEQEDVPSEPDFSSLELEDEEAIFEQHLTTLTVSLSGSPPTSSATSSKNKAASTAFTVSPPPHTAIARLKHKLSLSNTPPVHVAMAKPSSSLTQGLTQSILTAHTLVLPDAQIGHFSEKHLDIHNPYSSDLEWELTYNASPFVRKVRDTDESGGSRGKRPSSREKGGGGGGGGGGEIFKANYSVFWVSERRGITPPQSTSKVPIVFQPHDAGSFSQIWELKVCCDELGTKKLRISFGGRALANLSTKSQPELKSHDHQSRSHDRTEQITKWLSQTHHHLPATEPSAVVSSTTSATPLRKAVYIKDERVVFPPTKVGSKSTVKVRVCNRGPQRYQFDVIKPVPPFSVDHHNFELGSRQCARLPVHFFPTTPGEYAGVLAIRTNAGHQAFTELRGKSLS